MNLLEYQAKNLLSKYNLPILDNQVFFNLDEIKNYVLKSKCSLVAKCQINSGGRGKSGGIAFIKKSKDLYSFAKKWLNTRLITYQTDKQGELVHSILVEPKVKIFKEFYLGVLVDRDTSQITCIASSRGGVDIEETAKNFPHCIFKSIIDPLMGACSYQGRDLAFKLNLKNQQISQFNKIFKNIVCMFLEKDLLLVEINPLVLTENENFLCLDGKIIIDDNSWFRQKELFEIFNSGNEISPKSKKIIFSNNKKYKFNYLSLTGNIGCMVNGAGLAMATMDLIKLLGGSAANFLDIGGDTKKEDIIAALQIIVQDKNVKTILINIFGGIVCCNLISESLLEFLSKNKVNIPIVARLEGNNSKLASQKLINSKFNIFVTNNLIHATKEVILKTMESTCQS